MRGGTCDSFSSSPHRHCPHIQNHLDKAMILALITRAKRTFALLNYQVYQFYFLLSTVKMANLQIFPAVRCWILPNLPKYPFGGNADTQRFVFLLFYSCYRYLRLVSIEKTPTLWNLSIFSGRLEIGSTGYAPSWHEATTLQCL